jgi:anti-sigma regulatory factor (Ser/Thr protein kinase)/GNAT superfamily N-acetyltransferase
MPTQPPKVIRATFPNEADFAPIAQALAREAAVKVGFTGSALSQIEVAVEEAVSNVAEHAYDAEENITFDLICEMLPDALKIIIREHGIPFDPKHIPEFKSPQDLEDASTAGIGVFLMRSLMDECSFHNLGPGGKETHLVKHLGSQAGAERALAEAHPPEAEPEAIKEKIRYQVRGLREAEAIEVSKCAFKSHGYSFFDDHIYYPERLVELNRSGDMISFVAVTEDEVFMGHACLLFQYPEDRCAELTFVFVNPEYRSQGAFGRLLEALFAVESRRPLEGVYAYAVANHPFTQKAVARQGINDCGILLATSPASWKFKGIPGDPDQRISVILSFRYIGTPKKLTLFPPAHHREIVAKLYRNIGADHEYAAAASAPELSGESEILTGTNQSEGCAEIFVRRYGQDVVREVRRLLRGFCLQQYAAINLFLDLEIPTTYHITAEFEKLGFFFSGILPRARVGDVLILQYLNNVDVDYSKITAYSDMAKEILAYIRERDPNPVD